jgi:hypothetical protein
MSTRAEILFDKNLKWFPFHVIVGLIFLSDGSKSWVIFKFVEIKLMSDLNEYEWRKITKITCD